MRAGLGAVVAMVGLALGAGPAQAAKHCAEPSGAFTRATPAEAGFDAAKLQDAVDYGTSQASFSVRVYRYGCEVLADRTGPANAGAQYESWSMAKSVTSMVFGRAMTLGLISPDDPVGSLLPEADAAHGKVTMRDLLTQSSGLHWNGLRDYDIFMPDRIHDALVTPFDHAPGTFWEYSQSGPALVAEAVQRAIGEDFQAFAQRELFGPIGIAPGAWRWTRDSKGHTQGFYGVNMTPPDYARLGELMRRNGMWHGRRLLSQRYMRESVAPAATNGCYGWLIWVNAAKPCVLPTVSKRGVINTRGYPGLPADQYDFEGLFGQLVAVFPTQGILVVRTGQDPGLVNFAGATDWKLELYRRVLDALSDGTRPAPSSDATDVRTVARSDKDEGFQVSVQHPGEYTAPATLPPRDAVPAGNVDEPM